MQTSERILEQTQCWISTVVIAHAICPFAKQEFESKRIRYRQMPEDLEFSLDDVLQECQYLDKHPEIETSLLIYPKNLEDFDVFLEYHAIAEQQLVNSGYEGVYQFASFHPEYCFDGASDDDAANYTNRSPYPMLHIIREESLEQALKNYPHPEEIPERNIRYTRDLGINVMRRLLKHCVSHVQKT